MTVIESHSACVSVQRQQLAISAVNDYFISSDRMQCGPPLMALAVTRFSSVWKPLRRAAHWLLWQVSVAGTSRIGEEGSLTKYPDFVGDGPETSDGSTCCTPDDEGILCVGVNWKWRYTGRFFYFIFSPYSTAVLSHKNRRPLPYLLALPTYRNDIGDTLYFDGIQLRGSNSVFDKVAMGNAGFSSLSGTGSPDWEVPFSTLMPSNWALLCSLKADHCFTWLM
jgi:hypothetical protein